MQRRTKYLGLGLIALTFGCGGDEDPAGTTAGTTTTTPPAPPVTIDIVADASRDGKIDASDPDDQDHEADWDTTHGASFLANLDDDDDDGVRDVDDDVLNGDADLADLARLQVTAWPEAPDGASGVLTLDAMGAQNVRLWKHGLDGTWAEVGGSLGACNDPQGSCQTVPTVSFTVDEVRAGLELGIEGLRFRTSLDPAAWDGTVHVSYSVTDDKGAALTGEDVPDGIDQLTMKVAPWILWGNLSPFDTVYAASDSSKFTSGIKAATDEAGLTFTKISNWGDQWTQDYFQTAYTAIPAAGGAVQGMRIANPRPWGRSNSSSSLPVNYLMKHYLGPDRGVVVIYKTPNTGDSYDSHGNHDLLPPYSTATESYPLGRIIHGSGILKETKEFYAAQQVQGAPLKVDTSWLFVGHVDEAFSYVPAATPRGWKLLVASPALARQMLLDAQAAGHGAVQMFVGLQRYADAFSNNMVSATRSIDEVLADTQLMQDSDDAQAQLDAMRDDVQTALGLTDDEIVETPFLFEETGYGEVAWAPGTANSLVFGDYIVHPDPFGPQIDGADLWKQDLLDRLGTPALSLGKDGQGLKVHFTDDWYYYHILDGEVHCGSNPEGAPSAQAWWEVAR